MLVVLDHQVQLEIQDSKGSQEYPEPLEQVDQQGRPGLKGLQVQTASLGLRVLWGGPASAVFRDSRARRVLKDRWARLGRLDQQGP